MKKVRVLIVDDEPLAHKVVEGHCTKLDYIEVVGNCYDGISTINFLNDHTVDALLLDIQMPDLTGIELIESLRNETPKIIFTTAFTEYAVQGFDYDQVVDFLHKPIRFARFVKAIERLKKLLLLERNFERQVDAEAIVSEKSNYLHLKDNSITFKIEVAQISYVQAWGNYVKVFTDDEKLKIFRKTIKELEEELSVHGFVRIHKSYLVNSHKVIAIENTRVRLAKIALPIGKSYAISAKKQLS
jgi:DNA-binding LytR/AlgR family response regulator